MAKRTRKGEWHDCNADTGASSQDASPNGSEVSVRPDGSQGLSSDETATPGDTAQDAKPVAARLGEHSHESESQGASEAEAHLTWFARTVSRPGVSFRPRRRRLPRRLLAQATLSLGGDYGVSNAKRIAHGAKVSDSACCRAGEDLVAACAGDASTLSKSVNGQICVL